MLAQKVNFNSDDSALRKWGNPDMGMNFSRSFKSQDEQLSSLLSAEVQGIKKF